MRFVKMHGAGNDFLMTEADEDRDWPALAMAMCDRNRGAGADGLLVARRGPAVRMTLFNADGSEAEMSGNGVRCFAKFVVEAGMAQPDGERLPIETGAGRITVELRRKNREVVGASVDMGKPRLEASEIPVLAEQRGPILDLAVAVDGREYGVACVSMGNPHAVHFIETPVAEFPLASIGPSIEHNLLFPARTNFEVARVLSRGEIESRTWERGVGETLACGTGACAIVVSARLKGLVDDRVSVREPGGVLEVTWDGQGSVRLSGPVEYVYSGEWPEKTKGEE